MVSKTYYVEASDGTLLQCTKKQVKDVFRGIQHKQHRHVEDDF